MFVSWKNMKFMFHCDKERQEFKTQKISFWTENNKIFILFMVKFGALRALMYDINKIVMINTHKTSTEFYFWFKRQFWAHEKNY